MISWDSAVRFALSLPDTQMGLHYGQSAVKIASNGRAFLSAGKETTTSFCLQLDVDTVAMLIETDPDSFFQTPHYVGYGAILVRYNSTDPDRVRAMIERARDQAAARPKTRPRSPK